MSYTDTISDLLTRVRNASLARLAYTSIPASRLKVDIVKILQDEGFIRGFRLLRDGKQGKIKVALRYAENGQPVINGIRRISKPGCRSYIQSKDLSHGADNRKIGMYILTSSMGVMTDSKAKEKNVGGELIAHIW